MAALEYGSVQVDVAQADSTVVARYLLPLMLRKMASDGFVFTYPADPGRFSAPGCILASESYPLDLTTVNQNYIYNWTRDSAVTAIEIAEAQLPVAGAGSGPLIDYVTFARLCQSNAPTLAKASYTIEGQGRENWVEQNDGPALQTMAVLTGYADASGRRFGDRGQCGVRARLLPECKLQPLGGNLRAVVLHPRCSTAGSDPYLKGNALGITVPAGVDVVIAWLSQRLEDH